MIKNVNGNVWNFIQEGENRPSISFITEKTNLERFFFEQITFFFFSSRVYAHKHFKST